jgi:hypothetical protein
MLNKIVILSAILLGMAVPSNAQFAEKTGSRRVAGKSIQHDRAAPRDRQRNTQGDQRRVSTVSRSQRKPAPVLRSPRVHQPVHRPGISVVFGSRHHAPRYRTERVWVPGQVRRVFHPAEYEYRWDRHQRCRIQVLVRPAHYDTVQDPGHWEYRQVLCDDDRAPRRRGIHFHF